MAKFIILTIFVLYNILLESYAGDFHGIKITDTAKLVGNLRPTVDLKQGTLEGSSELSRDGRLYVSFKDIPYGKIKERFNVSLKTINNFKYQYKILIDINFTI